MSTTSLVARQCRLSEWAQMIRDCQNCPENMSVDEWCEVHSITKANYYYRMPQICRDKFFQIRKLDVKTYQDKKE